METTTTALQPKLIILSSNCLMAKELVDLRLLDYVAQVDENLVCPICRCPFIDPIRLPCDHTFCQDCVDSAFSGEIETLRLCPTCRTATSGQDTLPVPRFVLRMLDELMVECPKRCQVRVCRGDVNDHLACYCAESEEECDSEQCGLAVSRKLKGRGCLHQMKACDHCGEAVMEKDFEVCKTFLVLHWLTADGNNVGTWSKTLQRQDMPMFSLWRRRVSERL